MALKIGRKKTTDETPVAPAGNDAWDEFAAPPESERVPQATTEAAPRRASNGRVWMLGLGAFALVGGALAAWQFFGNKAAPEEDTATPVALVPRPASAPTAAPVAKATPVKVPMPVTRKSPAIVKRVKAGDAGIVSSKVVAPALKPESPGKPARMVPVKGMPTPIQPPEGMAGSPGRRSSRSSVVIAKVVPSRALTASLKAQLKTLWEQGAQAKHRGDKAGARRAWQQILKLRPGHPGVQAALDKL